jgi:PBP1b-binding outer membrane lipoprotein LpoB
MGNGFGNFKKINLTWGIHICPMVNAMRNVDQYTIITDTIRSSSLYSRTKGLISTDDSSLVSDNCYGCSLGVSRGRCMKTAV